MDTLDLAEASAAAGVPAVQLRRWAWEDWDVYERRPSGQLGPRNIGTRNKPLYLEQDVREWRRKHERVGAVTPDQNCAVISERASA